MQRPSEEQLKAIKKDLGTVRKEIKKLEAALLDRLDQVRAGLGADEIQRLGLSCSIPTWQPNSTVTSAHRQQIVEAVENWWDKYKVTLQDIEGERDGAAKRLKKYLDELGYRHNPLSHRERVRVRVFGVNRTSRNSRRS